MAVAALYALVLQAVLGGLLGGLMPGPASASALCAAHVGDPADPAAPDRALPGAHGDCCTAALAPVTALPPRADALPAAWPPEAARRLARIPADAPRARAPPDRTPPARGPPAA